MWMENAPMFLEKRTGRARMVPCDPHGLPLASSGHQKIVRIGGGGRIAVESGVLGDDDP